jgi:putative PIN family toxin of toxin-antitoxin system
MIRVVLDTNVLVSANLSDQGLESLVVSLVLNRKIRLCLSPPILDEYRRVLYYPRLKFEPAEIDRLLARLRRCGIKVVPDHPVSVPPDEPDNRFLECAEAARAEFLVTGNQKHFPNRWKLTDVVTARELLNRIGSSLLK